MADAIIVLNAGSSSLNFTIYQLAAGAGDLNLLTRGQIEGVATGSRGALRFKAKDRKGSVLADDALNAQPGRDAHLRAFAHLVQWARDEFGGVFSPVAIGHRVVHGGLEFAEPTLLTDAVIDKLDRLVPLAPLDQPHHLAAVRAVRSVCPDLPQVACFDTAFHRGRAPVTERFALPDELFRRGVRRWGFHGLSCSSVMNQLRDIAPDVAAGRVIVAHLGSSAASMCGIRDGRSVDTTMSFSMLDGLPMGTRCGRLDPGALLYLMQSRSYQEIETLLYKQSGLLGLSGGISDNLRELLASENPRAADAIEFFCYRAVREIGSLTAALGGLDALIFTAAVGENCPIIRQRICRDLSWLGIAIEPAANTRGRGCISSTGRSPSVWVIPTDEERVIADGTWAAVRAAGKAPKPVPSIAGHVN